MDVSVNCKRALRWLRRPGGPSLLGDGLLERARATSLALLGGAAAVGLAIVALALNQGWPLVAGSSIPPVPHQGVGEATVASRGGAAHSRPAGAGGAQAGARRRRHSGRAGAPTAGTGGPGAAVAPTHASADFVVSPAAPAKPRSGRSHGAPAPHATAPAGKHPAQQPPRTASPSPTAAEPAPAAREPTAAPPQTTPEATASEAPEEESSVPSWSEGKGHAYGRSEEWHGHGSSADEGEGGWDEGHGHDSYDHGHGD